MTHFPRIHRMSPGTAFIAAMLLGIAPSTFAQTTAPLSEIRAVWASRFEWPNADKAKAQNNITQLMGTLKANNFNAVMFQVRGQCDVHYPSKIDPWGKVYNWTDPGWDPLAFALQKARENGLEFHAYINTHTMMMDTPPAATSPQHVYNQHGPTSSGADCWLICDETGTPTTSSAESYRWLTPGNPQASLHTRRAIMEVVINYDVDGIHLDRIRTPGTQYSHDIVTQTRYWGEGNPDLLAWPDFMRRQFTDDLRRIYGQIAMVRPRTKLSCSPFGTVARDATTHYQAGTYGGYNSVYQDPWRWLREGCIDFAVPMIYQPETQFDLYQQLLTDWQERRGERFVVAGSSTQGGEKTTTGLVSELAEAQSQNTAGWCSFSYSSMSNYWQPLREQRYTQPASVPDMPWKSAPTKGIITGFVTDENGTPLVDAKISLRNDPLRNFDGSSTYNHLTGADGFFAILNVPPGTDHELTFSKRGRNLNTRQNISVRAGQVTQIDAQLSPNPVSPSLPPGTRIVESRNSAGDLVFGYDEQRSLAGTPFADTTVKSSAPGLVGKGGRYIGSGGHRASAEFRPVDLGSGSYNVYLTLSYGANNYSPGAGWELCSGNTVLSSGTVDLLYTNSDIVNKWYRLCGPVDLPDGPDTVLKITNNYANSNSVKGRFVTDAAKFEYIPRTAVQNWCLY